MSQHEDVRGEEWHFGVLTWKWSGWNREMVACARQIGCASSYVVQRSGESQEVCSPGLGIWGRPSGNVDCDNDIMLLNCRKYNLDPSIASSALQDYPLVVPNDHLNEGE